MPLSWYVNKQQMNFSDLKHALIDNFTSVGAAMPCRTVSFAFMAPQDNSTHPYKCSGSANAEN